MEQGLIIAREIAQSENKVLEYFLIARPHLDSFYYSIAVMSAEQGGKFCQVDKVTGNETRARGYFDCLLKGVVRPENLAEVLYEMIVR